MINAADLEKVRDEIAKAMAVTVTARVERVVLDALSEKSVICSWLSRKPQQKPRRRID